MDDRSRQVLFREMLLDLHYRLMLADELFCRAAECFVSAVSLNEWENRREIIQKIREYSQALQLINADLCRIVEGKQAVFPAEPAEWIYDLPDGEDMIQFQLERLHVIAEGLELTINRKLLHLEFKHE